jgi:stress-induced morphogen
MILNRRFCSESEGVGGGAEARLISLLRDRFPSATDMAVVDVSGGCGSMYEVFVEAPDFKGMRTVRQHQMITDALKAEIKDMHGLRISTAVSQT